MATELRTVLDTGVIVSALLLPRSVPRRAFDRALQEGKALASAATVHELDEVLRRPRIERYLREPERLQFLASFVREVAIVNVLNAVTECRDPKDNKLLELATSGEATSRYPSSGWKASRAGRCSGSGSRPRRSRSTRSDGF